MLINTIKKIIRKIPIVDSLVSNYPQKLAAFLGRIEISRISRLPRRKPSAARFLGKEIKFPDGYWFLHSINELFVEEVYKFKTEVKTPYIIDCGANIGLSIIYFKNLYPSAKILAFEPDKAIFNLLSDNIVQFNYNDVQLVNKGVWEEETTLSFLEEGTLGGRINSAEEKSSGFKSISIETARLKNYLEQKVDFLKIDIEGAEYEVLKDCSNSLKNVQFLFVEYHSALKSPQRLNEILGIITEAGFRYYIKEASHNVQYPFINNKSNYFDLQLNIFCYRD